MTTKRLMALFACSLALLQLVLRCQANNGPIQELCGDKDVWLRSLSDLRRTKAENCDGFVADAFRDLIKLVREPQICTMHKANSITHYLETYLGNGKQTELPNELARVAIAYGMQVNSQCKWAMIDDFHSYVDSKLDEADYKALEEWTRNDGPIARLLGPITRQADFPLPADFETLAPEFAIQNELAVEKMSTNPRLIRAKQICAKRFRPLYAPIVFPIAHLARNGLNYNEPKLSNYLSLSFTTRYQNTLWSRIVFLCETLKDLKVNDGLDGKMTPWKVTQLDAFHPDVELEDNILNTFDLRLKWSVSKFDVNLSETERFKMKLLDNKWKMLLAAFKSKETTVSLIRRAFEIVARKIGDKQSEELESTKRNMLSLLDSDKKSLTVKAVSKVFSGGKDVARLIAMIVEVLALDIWSFLSAKLFGEK